jgi:DNA polymerase III epsilon subunit-like protein
MAPTLYISLDVEASGPVPGMFSLLAIGACAVVDDGTEARLLEGAGNEFKVLLKPLANAKSDPEALKYAGGLVPEELETTGQHPREAFLGLIEWVERVRVGVGAYRAHFLAHAASFDWMYIRWYFELLGLPSVFGFAGIDIKAYAMGAMGITWEDTSKDALGKRMGLEPVDPLRLHDPLYDAHYQARLFAALVNARRRIGS